MLAPVAFLSGIDIVRDACRDEIIGRYVRRVMFDELMQTLNLPEEELRRFADSVLERFDNPFVDHQVTSIMLNSFPKYATRDLPGLKTYLERKGCLPEGLVLGLAAIIVYYRGGSRPDGTAIVPEDAPETLQLLSGLWSKDSVPELVKGVLGYKAVWNEDLNAIPGFAERVGYYIESILGRGMKETVAELAGGR